MLDRKRGGDPEEIKKPPHHQKDEVGQKTAFGVSKWYPQNEVQERKEKSTFSLRGKFSQKGEGQYIAVLCWGHNNPDFQGGWGLEAGENKKKKKEKKETSVQEAEKKKAPRRSPPSRTGDVIRDSTRGGQSYAEILKEMKTKVNPLDAGLEVLTIQRTRKGQSFLSYKKKGDVSAFEKALGQDVVKKADVRALVSKSFLEVTDLNETMKWVEVVAVFCIALGSSDPRM